MYSIKCYACNNTIESNELITTCPICLNSLDWNTSIPLQGAVEDAVPPTDTRGVTGTQPENGSDGKDMAD